MDDDLPPTERMPDHYRRQEKLLRPKTSDMRARTITEKLALTVLARDGIAAIWQLQIAAAEAHRTGHPSVAASILEIADAAEQAWLRAEGSRALT